MIDESREVRRRILSDLAERRRVYYSQIEQLRAGKDALSEVVAHVAGTIAAVQARLDGSEEDARAAAEVARRATELGPESESVGGVGSVPAEFSLATNPLEELDVGGGATELAEATAEASEEPLERADTVEAPIEESFTAREEVVADTSGATIVDELFARIRESSTAPAPTADASGLLPDEAARAGAAPPEPLDVGSVADQVTTSRGDEDEPVPAGLRVGDVAVERSELLRRRDELIEGALGELVHVLKRALRVEQNELLHRLRAAPGGTDPSTLSSTAEEAERYSAAAIPALSAIWRQGAAFGRERLSSVGRVVEVDGSDEAACRGAAGTVAASLGTEIASSIATRLARNLSDADAEGESLQRAVGAAYRDWKGERIEDAAGDYATNAFCLGTLEVVRSVGTRVSWVVDDGASRSADCDDNELAGLLEPGVAFPTGQPHPPAHGGCRCLLVPAGT